MFLKCKFFLVLITVSFGLVAGAAPSLPDIAALREAADSLHAAGRTDSALVVGAEARRLAVQMADNVQIVGTNAALGVFLRSSGRVEEALACYNDALALITSGALGENPSAEAVEEIASLYINLAVLDLDMAHKDEAVRSAESAARWIARSRDEALRSRVYGVVGSVLTGAGDLDKAIRYQELSYRDALAAGDTESAFRSAAYSLLIADRLTDSAAVTHWRSVCVGLFPQVEAVMARLVYYQVECSIALGKGDHAAAISYFDRILALDGIDSFPFVQLDCYNNMHLSYADMGDFERAYGTLLKAGAVRDTLYAREKAESLRDLTVRYETKETELALARSEARRSRTFVWLLASLAVLLIVAVVFVLYASRQRRRRMQREVDFARLRADIGRRLTRRYVEGLESERQRMARELHDGVCNDLLAIQMGMHNGASPQATAALIDSCRDSVRRISHELMPPEFAYATIDEVVRYFVGKQAEAVGSRIDITYSSDCEGCSWQDVPDAVALEVYRIAQEAVGNAVRHSSASAIKVSMSLHASTLTLLVADNGTFRPSAGRGLGLDTMARRAGAVDASVSVTHPDGGTEVRLIVSL